MSIAFVPIQRYVVDVYADGRYALIRDVNPVGESHYLNQHTTIQSVASLLEMTAAFVCNAPCGQQDYIEHIGATETSAIAARPDAKWMIAPDARYTYNGKNRRNPRYLSGECVYFVEHPVFPGLAKIGSTDDLFRRSKELYREHALRPVTTLAFIQTPLFRALEAYLHMAFASQRREGEWFRLERVLWFLRYGKSQVNPPPVIKSEESSLSQFAHMSAQVAELPF